MNDVIIIDDNFFSQFSPPNKRDKESKKIRQQLILEVEEIEEQLNNVALENSELRKACSKLENDLSSIAKAINRNVDMINQCNEQALVENQQLKTELGQQRKVFDSILPLLRKALEKNLEIQDFEMDYFMNHFKLSKNNLKPYLIDPNLAKVVMNNPYFQGCQTNGDFIQRCAKLQQQMKKQVSPEQKEAASLRERLRFLQQEKDKHSLYVASQFNSVRKIHDEQSMILKTRNKYATPSPPRKSRNVLIQKNVSLIRDSTDCSSSDITFSSHPSIFRTPRTKTSINFESPLSRSPINRSNI